MKDWLTIVIVILIVGISIDAVRRIRQHRRSALRMSRKMPDDDGFADAQGGGEFPSGGARVVEYRDPKDAINITHSLKQNYEATRVTKGAPMREPEQTSLDLEPKSPRRVVGGLDDQEFVNMAAQNDTSEAMDEAVESSATSSASGNVDKGFWGESDSNAGTEVPVHQEHALEDSESQFEPGMSSVFDQDIEDASAGGPALGSLDDLDDDTSGVLSEQVESPKPTRREKAAAKKSKVAKSKQTQQPAEERVSSDVKSVPDTGSVKPAEPKPVAPDLVIVINVMAKKEQWFSGEELLDVVLNHGFRFGEMDIFHRYETHEGEGNILFSLANMVKPGTFDVGSMDNFETPGLSLFLTLPVAQDSLEVFNLFVETAKSMVKDLQAELKDENRSVMTQQTIEHHRQRVIEYERQKRLERV